MFRDKNQLTLPGIPKEESSASIRGAVRSRLVGLELRQALREKRRVKKRARDAKYRARKLRGEVA